MRECVVTVKAASILCGSCSVSLFLVFRSKFIHLGVLSKTAENASAGECRRLYVTRVVSRIALFLFSPTDLGARTSAWI